MAVPIQTPMNSYTADGNTTVFPYSFYTTEYTDLVVQVGLNPVTTGFTVTGMGNANGGDVTFTTPPAAGSEISIFRQTPVGRLTSYQDNGDLLARDINADFDRIWLVQQEQKAASAATLSRPVSGGAWDAQKFRITGIATAVQPSDAVPLGQMQTLNNSAAIAAVDAGASMRAAALSADAAKTYSENAAASATDAEAAATIAENAAKQATADANAAITTVVSTTMAPLIAAARSASGSAALSAASALTNKDAAGLSATNAHTSELNAAASETNAKGYAAAANSSRNTAAAAATAAQQISLSLDIAGINQNIASKVSQATYDHDKAAFATTAAVNTLLGGYATQTDLQTAISGLALPATVPTTAAGAVNNWSSVNAFTSTVTCTNAPTQATDVVNKAYADGLLQGYPSPANLITVSKLNRFSAMQSFDSGATVSYPSGVSMGDTSVVGKKYVDDAVSGAVSGIDLSKVARVDSVNTFGDVQTFDSAANFNKSVSVLGGGTLQGTLNIKGHDTGGRATRVQAVAGTAGAPEFRFSTASVFQVPHPDGKDDSAAVTYKSMTDAIAAGGGGGSGSTVDTSKLVALAGAQVITGPKTVRDVEFGVMGDTAKLTVGDGGSVDFSGAFTVRLPAPAGDDDAATVKYVKDRIIDGSKFVQLDSYETFTGNPKFGGGFDLTGGQVFIPLTSPPVVGVHLENAISVTVPTSTGKTNNEAVNVGFLKSDPEGLLFHSRSAHNDLFIDFGADTLQQGYYLTMPAGITGGPAELDQVDDADTVLVICYPHPISANSVHVQQLIHVATGRTWLRQLVSKQHVMVWSPWALAGAGGAGSAVAVANGAPLDTHQVVAGRWYGPTTAFVQIGFTELKALGLVSAMTDVVGLTAEVFGSYAVQTAIGLKTGKRVIRSGSGSTWSAWS